MASRPTADALGLIAIDIHYDFEYGLLDAKLEGIDISSMNETELVLWIRSTFAYRHQIKNWWHFRNRVVAEFDKRDLPLTLLAGLLETADGETR